jgi:hypothetical protein
MSVDLLLKTARASAKLASTMLGITAQAAALLLQHI